MVVAVVKETAARERRVALTPASAARLIKAGVEVFVEAGAGAGSRIGDAAFREVGAKIVGSRDEAFAADIVLQVRTTPANPERGQADLELMRPELILVGMADPLGNLEGISAVASTGVSLLALELIPRITRAQSMDVLSSMATVAGYQAVLMAAETLGKLCPMLTTAAGTIKPAKAFVIGAGVAGLQAIAMCRRMGAIVRAYDVRPAVKEQVESLGAEFVQLKLKAGDAEDQGGYAKAMDDEFYARQRELMAEVVADSDLVITTAAIPGKPSPLLITAAAVRGMRPGSVIVDLAAERGGNCELTQADERIEEHDVTILGPTDLPSRKPATASQMFGNNVANLLLHLIQDGKLALNREDEIITETLATEGGKVVHRRLRELIEGPPPESASEAAPSPGDAPAAPADADEPAANESTEQGESTDDSN